MTSLRRWKKSLVLKVLLMLSLISIGFLLRASKYSLNKTGIHYEKPEKLNADRDLPSLFQQRLVHLDLKGAPPKLSYLSELLVHVKRLGGTGFLIEYEDVFPFEGNLSLLSAENAYGRGDLENFLRLCAVQNMSVIPLVQTFGHLEYALKLKEFAHFREDPFHPGHLCPRQNGTNEFIELLLNQTIEFHTRVPIHLTHIHIGGEGFLQTPVCPLCQMVDQSQLYLVHLKTVSNIIQNNWPELKIILWSDELLNLDPDFVKLYKIDYDRVELMIRSKLSPKKLQLLKDYEKVFPALWAASPFRGDPNPYQLIPVLGESLNSVFTWLDVVISRQQFLYDRFQGIILTGSQKSDHFAVLDELLPAAIPSLFLSLDTANLTVPLHYDDVIRLHDVLKCPSNKPLAFFEYFYNSSILWNCSYFGQTVYETMEAVEKHIKRVRDFAEHFQYEMSLYQVDNNLSPSLKIAMKSCLDNIALLKSAAHMLQDGLEEIYDEYTIGNYIQQNIYSIIKPMQAILKKIQNVRNLKYWPRRSLEVPQHIKDLYMDLWDVEKPEKSNFATN